MSIEEMTVDFRGQGVTLVTGPKGVGKSALLVEPLLWLFYNTLNRSELKTFTGRVRRRYRGEDVEGPPTSVEAWFSHNGHNIYAKRTLGKGYELAVDGAAATPYRDADDAVSNSVGLPSSLFRSICVLGQGFSQRFSGFKDSDRSAVIEDFIDSIVYEEAQKRSQDADVAIDQQLRTLIGNQQAIDGMLSHQRAAVASQTQRLAEIDAYVTATRANLDAEAFQLGAAKQSRATERAALQNERAESNSQDRYLYQQITVLGSAHLAQQSALGALAEARNTLQTTLTRLQTWGVCDCPTCFQQVPQEHLAGHVQRLGEELPKAVAAFDSAHQASLECERQINAVNAERIRLSVRGAEVHNRVAAIDTADAMGDARFEVIQRELGQLDDMKISAEAELRRVEAAQADMESKAQATQAAVATLQGERQYVSWWTEGFSIRMLRGARLGSTLEKMNEPLNDYCNRLFDGLIQVRLSPVKQQKTAAPKSAVSVEVQGPSGCYELASGGQQRCIDLALHFALRRFASKAAKGWSSNFLIGDEVFDHLDQATAERAVSIIREEAPRVFLITHSPALRALCDSVWHVRYEDERTRL